MLKNLFDAAPSHVAEAYARKNIADVPGTCNCMDTGVKARACGCKEDTATVLRAYGHKEDTAGVAGACFQKEDTAKVAGLSEHDIEVSGHKEDTVGVTAEVLGHAAALEVTPVVVCLVAGLRVININP